MNWADEARADYIEREKNGYALPCLPNSTRPAIVPWTPERIIEVQAETIARLGARLKSAEKMIAALVKLGGERGFRLDALRAMVEGLEDVST